MAQAARPIDKVRASRDRVAWRMLYIEVFQDAFGDVGVQHVDLARVTSEEGTPDQEYGMNSSRT